MSQFLSYYTKFLDSPTRGYLGKLLTTVIYSSASFISDFQQTRTYFSTVNKISGQLVMKFVGY